LGETGTGKGLVAQAIHTRKGEETPFVSIRGGFGPETLLCIKLFGVRENYPGIHNEERHIGRLEAAGAGTLLLDEIGAMEVELQEKLYRVLKDRRFNPLGDEKPLPLLAQVIASTNADLESAIKEGLIREGLYHQLNLIQIVLPPLRQRKEDIPLLVQYHLDQHEKQSGRRVEILPQAMDKLIDYHWPGNIRELFHALEEVLTTYSSRLLTPRHFDFLYSKPLTAREIAPVDLSIEDLHQKVRSYEKEFLRKTLEAAGWNQTKVATILKLSRANLQRKLEQYGLRKENTT
jgi:DNA-binding NtrC family response regulator